MSTTSILKSIPKQLRLTETGEITWQADATNPLPGEAIASVVKGDAVTTPKIKMLDTPLTKAEPADELAVFVQKWLDVYINEGLEPLFKLKHDDLPEGAPRDIAQKLFDALGIIPRDDIQSDIDKMDEDMRAALRPKKIRFGPLLVYLPELKKPAAVRLQAMLLSLWNDKDLPATVPSDGIVSFSVTDIENIDKDYYRAIGYPVYGPRAMRVDMLDRVVCAVYDSADKGKFSAQHQMAEWLGSNIEDLYLILEAMGHKKISEPAPKEEKTEASVEGAVDAPETKAEETAKTNVEDKPQEPQEKPELATFALKRGKASASANQSKPYNNNKKKLEGFTSGKKPFKKKPHQGKKPPQKERVYKAEAKSNPEDNPFAILSQLKVSGKKDD